MSRLPRAVDEAMDRLLHYHFTSGDARRDFERAAEDHDDVRKVAQFVRRLGQAFRGRESLDFAGALELIERIEALHKLEEMLFNGDFESIDLDHVGEQFGRGIAAGIANLRRLLAVLSEAGYVVSKSGKMVLTAKGARKLGQLALREIHRSLLYDATGRHETGRKGPMELDAEATKRYRFGDLLDVDAAATVANAVRRDPRLPIRLAPDDIEVHESTYVTRNATVLLLDMSWSMSWEGRFAAAKKVALAMDCLMRIRYPRDFFAIVGLYTRAVDWAIERVVVSLTDLVNENESYYKQFGEYLYQPKKLDELVATSMLDVQDPYSEPRDTEGWPTFNSRSDEFGIGPGETPVELWLCWDNTRRTLTKIARRKMVLAHGLAPTPDGMDPYWPVKAVIVPGRVYGDSILNWIGPLCKLQTRLKRARADEVLLNIWQQFVYRIGTITSPRLFMRPGNAEDPSL